MSIAGVISGSGNLSKIGGGTLSLWAANTFSGVTTVNTGTLLLGNSLALQQSTLIRAARGRSVLARCWRRPWVASKALGTSASRTPPMLR